MKPVKLALSIFVCQAAGAIGAIFTSPSVSTWYATLAKPSFTPPGWVFASAWITLYILMGIALYLILGRKNNKKAVTLFNIQLALNALWSIIFFGLKSPLLAFIEIIALWTAILLTTISFWKIDRKAAYLLLPYVVWVTFATALNLAIVVLN